MVGKLVHAVPCAELEQEAIDFIREFERYHSQPFGTAGLEEYAEDYSGWLRRLAEKRTLPPGGKKVPSETFFLVREEDHRIVGMITIRRYLNDALRHLGGHIGYCIRPTERRKGYNKRNLYLGLCFCWRCGIEEVFIDCDKENIASAKSAVALGGTLVEEFYDDQQFHCQVQKYVIPVNDAVARFRAVYDPD